MAITKRLRYEVLRRDGHRCVYCGATSKETQLVVDHVLAIALGGTDDVANLVTSCADCNIGKASAVADEAFVARVDEDSQRWMRAMAAAAKMRRDARQAHDQEIEQLAEAWDKWTYKRDESKIPRPENWRETAYDFLVAGLPVEEMIRLVTVAMSASQLTRMDYPEWRYFVGCCKRVLGEIEVSARALIDARDAAVMKASRSDDAFAEPTLDDLP